MLQGQVREVAHFIELMNHSKEFQCIELKEQRNELYSIGDRNVYELCEWRGSHKEKLKKNNNVVDREVLKLDKSDSQQRREFKKKIACPVHYVLLRSQIK